MIATPTQADLPGIAARRVLFSGAISAIAVIAGWLLYFAFLAGIGALYAALVGATIAAVIHAVQHYFHIARHEASASAHGQHTQTAEHGNSNAPRSPSFAAAAQAGAIILGFVGIVSVHVVTELTHELLVPCMVSIVTLVPIGMLLGAIFSSPKPAEFNLPMIAFGIPIGGGLIGLGAAAVAYATQWAMGQHPEFWPIAGWWVLVGVGLFAAGRGKQLNVRRSVIGVALALVIVLASAWTSRSNTASSSTSQPSLDVRQPSAGVFSLWLLILRSRDDAIRAPDIPSHVWDNALAHARREWAEARNRHDEKEQVSNDGPLRSAWGSTLARWCGCSEQIRGAPPEETTNENPQHGNNSTSQPIDQSPAYIAMYPEGGPRSMPYLDYSKFRVQTWDGGRVVCGQLRMGLESGLVRSWLVMILFSLGLGLAPRVERALRPSDYPSSRTRRMDGLMWLSVGALTIGGIFVVRASGGHEPAPENDVPKRTFACVAKIDCGGPADMIGSARAWKVARDEYVRRTCDELTAAGFNTLWLDNLDYEMLPVWMNAAAKHGVRVIAPEFDSPTSLFGAPTSLSPSMFSGTGGLAPYLSSPTLAGLWLGTTEGPTKRSAEVLRAAADSRRSYQPHLLTVAEFASVTSAASGAKAILPGCIAWREARFRGDDGDHVIRERRTTARAIAESIGSRFWVIIDGDETIRASDFGTSSAGVAAPPFDPALLRLQINSSILDGASGVGMSFRQRPLQPPRERPSLLRRDSAPPARIAVGRETPSESILEAGRAFRRFRSLESTLGNITLGESHATAMHGSELTTEPHAGSGAEPRDVDAQIVSIGKVQLRTFTDHSTNRRFVLLLNTDVAEWQHTTLPGTVVAERWIDVETGQVWDRRDFQKLILDPGGMLLLQASDHRPE